jgi:transcriptional regulator with XRE-family HTH domain
VFGTRLRRGGFDTSTEIDTGLGTRLKAARQRLGWSREALAYHAGISWSAIAQVESGRRRNIRPHTLSSLAGALGVTIDYLIRGGTTDAVMLGHRALLYDTDEEFLNTTGPFLAEGIENSEAVLAVTTSANIALLRERLGPIARQVEFAEAPNWYQTPPSALEKYRAFLNAKLDAGAPWIRIVGEPVWTDRSESDVRLWTRYESLINLVFSAAPATILCPYDIRSLDPEIVRQAGVTHPHTIGRDGLTISPDYADPTGVVLGP